MIRLTERPRSYRLTFPTQTDRRYKISKSGWATLFLAKISPKLSTEYRCLGKGIDHYSEIKERSKTLAA